MPSFDVVSEVFKPDLKHAVENATRALSKRWDFKNIDASFSIEEKPYQIVMSAESEFQLQQLAILLRDQLSARKIDARCLDFSREATASGKAIKQTIGVHIGLELDMAKSISKGLKQALPKLTSQIQGDKVRVTGKSRDELQQAIAFLKQTMLERPLQFINFKE